MRTIIHHQTGEVLYEGHAWRRFLRLFHLTTTSEEGEEVWAAPPARRAGPLGLRVRGRFIRRPFP